MKQYVCLSVERIDAEILNLVTILNRKTMKKNILKVAFVAAIAMATGIQVFNAQKTETLSEVAMANVEALAADDDYFYTIECGFHGCVIDFSWDCFYPEGALLRYCPNMRGA